MEKIKEIMKKIFEKKLFVYVALPVMGFVISFTTVYAWTHNVLPMWSVDSGKHMDWNGSTSYSTAWNGGISIWNNHRSGVIRADTIWTINDVNVQDVSYIDNNVAGRTTFYVAAGHGSSDIRFATQYMNLLSATKKKVVAAHELGHALGLNENKYLSYVLMYQYIDQSTNNGTLDLEDIENYDFMYNNKY